MNLLNNIGKNGKLVVKNGVYSMMSSVFGQAITLLSSIVMGRLLGVEGMGSYTFAMTFSGIVFLFLNLGLVGILQRNIAQDVASAEKNYANILSIRLFFSLPMSLIIGIILAFIMNRQDDLSMLLFACIYTGFTGIYSLISEGITAVEKFQVTLIFGMLQKMFCFFMTFLTLYFTKSMLFMLICYDIIFLILIVIELIYVNKTLCKIRLRLDFLFCKNLLKESIPIMFVGAAEYLSLKSDVLILTLMLGEAATGLYSISSNIYIAASLVPLSLEKAVIPTFNRMIANKENVSNLVRKTSQIMILSAILLIVGIFVAGRFGIVLLWGKAFEEADVSLRILSISLIFMPANRLLGDMLVGLKRQMVAAKCCIAGAMFNIVSNIFLVPLMGLNAVAITTVITEFLVTAAEGYFYKRNYKCVVE